MSEPDTNWHVLTVARNGTISILKNLTREAAQETVNLLKPSDRFYRRHSTQGEIYKVLAFGAESSEPIQGWGLATPMPLCE